MKEDSDSDYAFSVCVLIGVGFIWGVTNPFLEKQLNSKQEKFSFSLKYLINLFLRISILLPYAIN
jgi:hypothetical protein